MELQGTWVLLVLVLIFAVGGFSVKLYKLATPNLSKVYHIFRFNMDSYGFQFRNDHINQTA